ncbi:GDSL esterase/lipase At4g16230-like [Pistacia vera]|uniref:GDSL esterase/lipase At4g16230-like n=1 Tax=Pistacia vera TaxID=55513 RepID=UPI001262C340|nr:GDSL esterase/lipase At4g16230-like [Pistacia vera]
MERLKSFRYVSQVLTIYLVVGTCSGKSVPAIFVFGDSLADAGNNFYIKTIAKPVSPNGIDFGTTGPSGRYTNNRTFFDLIGEELGFENLTPPYMAPTTVGDMILKGVNYASSGAGLLNETGAFFGDLINFDMQISYFEKTRQDIISRIGEQAAKSLLTQSLYFLAIGLNDILNFKANTLGKNLSPDAYTDNVISRFRFQLTL